MHFSRLATGAAAALCLVAPSLAGYALEDDYSASNFFDMFSFFTAADPTAGFVQYIDQGTAQSQGLISSNSSSVYMGVDHTNVAPNGRSSVRVTSNKVYNHGLIILDLEHMPEGCGTWPAFWMVGPNWPNSGEIDIIEGVNQQTSNAMTLHTGPGCGITNSIPFAGAIQTASCDVDAPGQAANAGCSIDAPSSNTYGSGLNAIGGGVYATEWTSNAISIYFFPRSSIPSDISSGNPDPSGWGEPQAVFAGACDLDSSVVNQQIVFDTTFCGDWAGAVWSSGSCAQQASTCNAFVENNPSAFSNAYWSINSLKVYQDNGNTPPIVSSSAGLTTTLAPVSTATNAPTGVATTLAPSVSSLAPIPTSPFEVSVIEPGQPQSSSSQAVSIQAVPTPSTTAAPSPSSGGGSPFEVNSIQGDGFGISGESIPAPTPTPAPTPAPTPGNASPSDTETLGSADDVEVQSIGQERRAVPVVATTLVRASRTGLAPAIARSTTKVILPAVRSTSQGQGEEEEEQNAVKRVHARHLLGHRQRRHNNINILGF